MNPHGWLGWLRWVVAIALPLLSAIACGSDSLVGGDCRVGLSECSLKCVDLARDSNNCGACGHRCGAGVRCVAGVCDGEGGAGDAGRGSDDGAPADAGPADGSIGDETSEAGSAGDGTSGVDGTGDGASGLPACPPPFDSPQHCGECATQCGGSTPLCGLQGGTFACVSLCEAPLEACSGECVNKFSDEKNCGGCGIVCASGICLGGACIGKGYGHQIVIGMDYADATLSQSSAQVTMLGNAVFQSGRATVRVFAYEEYADPATVTRVEGWLTSAAAARGRGIDIAHATDWTSTPEELTVATYEVLFVFDQLLAPSDRMATIGTFWNGSMTAFAKGGGIIVALDGGSPGRMRDFLTNGGLLPIADETDVTGSQIAVDAPTDVVGLNLPNVFAAKKSTLAFSTTQAADNLHVFVVKDQTGRLPIVVHSVPAP